MIHRGMIQFNANQIIKPPSYLHEVTEISFESAIVFDQDAIDRLYDSLGQKRSIEIQFPDGSKVTGENARLCSFNVDRSLGLNPKVVCEVEFYPPINKVRPTRRCVACSHHKRKPWVKSPRKLRGLK